MQRRDNTPVLAGGYVASPTRWRQRDAFVSVLMAPTEGLSAPSDKMVRFRLARAFPQRRTALVEIAVKAAIVPERLAKTSSWLQVIRAGIVGRPTLRAGNGCALSYRILPASALSSAILLAQVKPTRGMARLPAIALGQASVWSTSWLPEQGCPLALSGCELS
jgi:hypothetical protein